MGTGRHDCCRRHRWTAAVQAQSGRRTRSAADHGQPPRRRDLVDTVFCAAAGFAGFGSTDAGANYGSDRRFLPRRGAGFRWRPRRAAAAAS